MKSIINWINYGDLIPPFLTPLPLNGEELIKFLVFVTLWEFRFIITKPLPLISTPILYLYIHQMLQFLSFNLHCRDINSILL